ncbi:efflux RND transporter permease subunit [Salinactinospora qingdaonensis]|uniref:Efflux RND transporter permease subunit n=1 Tax=Salinactinospora qingdaonensis TaxID=702744 RepID=A0ABP7F1B8_9ACTN
MSRLAKLSLGNRALILLITLASIVFGLIATGSAKRELMPSLELPMAMVGAQYQGASPEVVENEVTEPLEQAVKGVSGVTDYTSTSSNGSAQVQVEFDYGDNTDDVVRSLQQAVDQVRPTLPDDVETYVQAFSTSDIPVVVLSAGTDDGDAQSLADPLEEQVVPELESIDGVRAAQVSGVRESTVTVTPDEDELEDEGLTANDVTSALQASGALLPGGDITQDERSLTVTTGGQLQSLDDVRNIWLTPSGSAAAVPSGAAAAQAGVPAAEAQEPEPVKLSEVAEVELRPDERSSITRTNGQPSLGISIFSTPEGNTVEISEAVEERLSELEPLLGENAEISVIFDQAPFINESIVAMAEEGGLGLIFAVLVILVFLLSVRSTLVTAVSIPVSLLIAMLGVQALDYSLNILTLGALTVAVGRVVDDSIVVLENIKRHMNYGEEKFTAVFQGVREVAAAVTSATLITIAVFAPMAFVGGQVGELFAPFALTVSAALAASLLVSLTIIPVLAYWFMRPRVVPPEDVERVKAEENQRELRTPLQRAYLPIIRWTTRHRVITLTAALALLLGTGLITPLVQTNFLGNQGQNTFSVTQELPVGSSMAKADEEAAKVEAELADLSWVENYQASFGGGGLNAMFGMGGGADSISYTLTTDPDGDQQEYEERLREILNGVDTDAQPRLQSAGGGSTLEVELRADDTATLQEATELVEDTVSDIPGAAEVRNNLAAEQPALEVQVDAEQAAEEGLTEAQIGQAVSQAFRGANVGSVTIDETQRDLVVRATERPDSVEQLENLDITGPTGTVELSEVADVEEVQQPPQLTRSGGVRSAIVSATPTAEDLGSVTAELTTALNELDLPEGATATIGGTSSEQAEAFMQLGLAMLAAIVIVYLIMVATFKSLMQPLILLVSIPFAATGALGLLLLTGTPLGVPALIGLLMLIGIVVTNAVVLIDLVNQYRVEGMELRAAVVEGSRHRLRPVIMTALATIGALTPMALGITGGGAFISQPLAIVVIGGLFTSTLLTLILVPVLYTMTESVRERGARRREERRTAKIEAERAKRDSGAEDASEKETEQV